MLKGVPIFRRSYSSLNSSAWLTRQKKDVYVKKARYQNYRARSAFKLIELSDKYELIKPGMVVLDLGGAPGSWTQVICEKLQLENPPHNKIGMAICVDIQPISPINNAIIIDRCDFTKPLNQARILDVLDGKKVDLVASDMAPSCTGLGAIDHSAIAQLSYFALSFSIKVLKPGGNFVTKLWDGDKTLKILETCRKFFELASIVKPHASRKESSELFIVAKNFQF